MLNFKRYKNVRKIARFGILVSFLIIFLLVFLTYYGQNTGNFIMTLDEDSYDRGIVLCENSTFDTESRWLTADPVENVRDITLPTIKIEEIVNTDGAYVDKSSRYLAYTFYVKNIGVEVTSVNYQIKITEETKNISKAIRCAIIVDGQMQESSRSSIPVLKYEMYNIYMAKDTISYTYPSYYDDVNIVNFQTDNIICTNTITSLRPAQTKKISIIVWLEGEDPECTAELYSAKIKMVMNLSVNEIS
jgi:hypothetical protein